MVARVTRWTDEDYAAWQQRHAQPSAPVPVVLDADPFIARLISAGLPLPVREYVFLVDRDFRADYCWLEQRVIAEKQGFRDHSTRKGLHRDYEKANLAQLNGWRYFQWTPAQLLTEQCLWLLRQVL